MELSNLWCVSKKMELFNNISNDKSKDKSKDKQNKKKKIRIPKVPVVFLEDQEEEMYFEEVEMDFEEIEIEKDEIEKEMESEKVDWIDLSTFLFEAGIVFLSDKLNREKGKNILGLITYQSMLHPMGEFHLFLNNCVSGCLRTAITIHDAIQQLPRHGHTLACGMTASVGSLILISGHERIAQLNARILIQEPKWKLQREKFDIQRNEYLPRIICDKRNGKKDKKRKKRQNSRHDVHVREAKKQFDSLTEYVHEIFVSKTGQSYETIQKDLKKKVVMSAKQAQDYGIIDRIVMDFRIESVLDENLDENGDDTPGWR